MTHPLSEELRKLADGDVSDPDANRYRLKVKGLRDALRRAADALDMTCELGRYHGDKHEALEAERDELRRQVKEGDELRQEYLDEWQKEVAELRRQLDVCQRNCEDLKLTVLHVTEAAERAEAQAARYREALEHIEGICPRDWLPWITKALCEPETGSQG